MFGKFFASAFTGSMMASGAEVFAVWAYVIAHAVDSRVELNPRLLAAVIGAPVDRIESAIETLCAPDPVSRNKDHDGRRMVREGEFQYFVTGHQKYRQMRDESDRREYNRVAQQRSRAKKVAVNSDVNMSNDLSSVSANTEAEAEAETEVKRDSSAELTCPYQKVVDSYHNALPDLPRVRLMGASRKRAIKKLWCWVMSSAKSDGSRRATNEAEALEWLGEYFARASANDFLMGRLARSGEHSNWQCDLDFLLTEKGLKHVIEKTREAA